VRFEAKKKKRTSEQLYRPCSCLRLQHWLNFL